MSAEQSRITAAQSAKVKIQDLIENLAEGGYCEFEVPSDIFFDDSVKKHFEGKGYTITSDNVIKW